MATGRRPGCAPGFDSLKRLKLLFVLAWLGLLAAELGVRYYMTHVLHRSGYPLYRFNSYRIYEHIPGYREGENGRDWVVINNQGFRRVKDTSTARPPKTFRVFLMGGSAAYGMSSQAPYPIAHLYPEETIDAVLESLLKQRHPDMDFEVINAAQVGYQVQQHTAYLQSELLNFEPNLVIFNDGVNDHYVDNPDYDYYRDCAFQFWKSRLQSPSFLGCLDYGAEWLGGISACARFWTYQRRRADILEHYEHGPQMVIAYQQDGERIRAHRACAARGFLRSVETNLLLCRARGVKVLVTRQAQLGLRDPALLTPAETSFLPYEKYQKNYQVLAPVVGQELSELCVRYDTPFVDLLPAFNAKQLAGQQLFIDWCHLTALGSRITAEAMLPEVERALAKQAR